jgi:ligand-binding sensor domain-containing protein
MERSNISVDLMSSRHQCCSWRSRYGALAGMLLCWITVQLHAQTPFFKQHVPLYRNTAGCTALFEDSAGWMWFAGKHFVYRYDGIRFQEFALPDSTREASVSSIGEFDQHVWFGFSDGRIGRVAVDPGISPMPDYLSVLPLEAPRIQLWQPEEGLPRKSITGFSPDKQGNWWISTYGEGLYCWHQNHLYQFNAADEGLGGDDIYALTTDRLGNAWVATDGGIAICSMDAQHRKTVDLLQKSAEGIPDEIITALITDTEGNIIAGTYEYGVYKIIATSRKVVKCTRQWTLGAVTSLVSMGTDELWAGTNTTGLIKIDLCDGSYYPVQAPGARVLRMGKNREGLLWCLFDKGNIYSFNPRISHFSTPEPEVQALCFGRDRNRLWLGTQQHLYFLENGKCQLVPGIQENILAIWESPQGQLWVGTFGHGVLILDKNGRMLRRLDEKTGLNNGSILSLTGNTTSVWIASLGGVMKIPLLSDGMPGKVQLCEDLGNSYVYKVFIDRKNRVWFGTDGKGLYVQEKDQVRTYTEAAGIHLKTIYSITEDSLGRIWMITDDNHLLRYDDREFRAFGRVNGLHGLSMVSLTTDRNGMILIGYEDGIDVLNPARKDHVTFLDAAQGMKLEGLNLNAVCNDRHGNAWFGGKNGLVRLAAYDEKFLDDPTPAITGVSIYLEPIDYTRKTRFRYNQNYFIFNFLGLWYTQPEAVLYKYRLEGFDPDWKISRDHVASYPNLPPGSYLFRVQTSEHGNFDQVPEAFWAFTVLQPFWTRWWFQGLVLMLLTGLVLWVMYIREKRVQREANLRKESVESQFALLKSQINPHFLFNSFNTLITIIEENPGSAVEYVEHLSDFYRSILVYREKDMIPLQEELELARNFSYLLKRRFEDKFQIRIHVDPVQNGQVLTLALQLLLENAVKHNVIAQNKPLIVDIFCEAQQYLVVRNTLQHKTNPEPGTHFGLQSLVHRYQLLKARPVVIETTRQYFTVKIPLIFS